MASYTERKQIIARCVLSRLRATYQETPQTIGIAEEIGRLIIARLPSEYDDAAIEAVCTAATTEVIKTHRSMKWPVPATVYQAVCGELAKRTTSEAMEAMDELKARDRPVQAPSDDWTVEGARQRIAMVEAEMREPMDPWRTKICRLLLDLARKGEQRAIDRQEVT